MPTAREQAREAVVIRLRDIYQQEPNGYDLANIASDVWEPIVRALVDAGYLDTNDETGDMWCHFCDGSYHGPPGIFTTFDEVKMYHTDDCAWVRAKEALG